MVSVVADSIEATVAGSAYYGFSAFAGERVAGQCAYSFLMCNTKDFSQDKIKDMI